MRRTIVAPVLLALVSGCGAAPGQGDAVSTARRAPVITGYALEGSATPASITRDGDLVRVVGVDGVSLLTPRRVSRLGAEARALRDAAHRARRTSILLFSNYNAAIGDFDERRAYRMLSSRARSRAVVRTLVRRARGFDGVQIDLESLKRRDTRGLVRFTRLLRRSLPGKQISMAFMASGSARGYAARGYDLTRLARLLDVAVLMSYDQHGPWSGAGPIASLPWVRRELAYFVTRIPRSKVDLGAAGYGYQWGARPAELTVAQARAAAGDRARWSSSDGEWHATLPGGRTIWWDDARSFALRRDLAESEGLHGVAVWELGSSGSLGN